MKPRFQIMYVVRFFNGGSTGGTMDVYANEKTTLESVEKMAMNEVVEKFKDSLPEGDNLNIQKIEVTVITIK